ncbi:MAG: DEAD/DEAH box helicase family protein [Desulfovibrio sp.]|nr:DEAD/DEAH box helicase family protein [Desulfovibrio sp.]
MSSYYTLDINNIIEQWHHKKKAPYEHQAEAFKYLTETLPIPINNYRGTLLVLPTGGGKTFTAVNWICRNVISRNIKVLWLAHSSYLIDQAAEAFREEIHNVNGRDIINLRIVSSNSVHANADSISVTDDILVCTTQTAIKTYSSKALDNTGCTIFTPFKKFIDNCAETSLFIVIDEAHHTPAYGCRTLLIAIRNSIKNLYILGLTATPMHNDKKISGWLEKIYNKWICYNAEVPKLQHKKILAIPKYININTNISMEIDDSLYNRLIYNHKDLPESIIDDLIRKQGRNDTIISHYIDNKNEYGKTIIFADRSWQCEYIAKKLNSVGIKTGAVYSTIVTGNSGPCYSESGRRNDEDNRRIMQEFKNDKLDVIVNINMLAEGVDVPDVKTVMLTRQTTSAIRYTQMIGRALRGEKAGGGPGKAYANIVLFDDNWSRLLPWANQSALGGGIDDTRPVTQGRDPMILVSIHLMRLAIDDVNYQPYSILPFLTFIPVGFYVCNYTVDISENDIEELVPFEENIIVYDFNKEKYDIMLQSISTDLITIYAEEILTDEMKINSEKLADEFFDMKGSGLDNFDGMLVDNIIKILRHTAQNDLYPTFIDFKDRDTYDLDNFARKWENETQSQIQIHLHNIYEDSDKYWKVFYKNFHDFKSAYDSSVNRIYYIPPPPPHPHPPIPQQQQPFGTLSELTDEMRNAVFTRDNDTCLRCGKKRNRGVVLNIDHIMPISLGGTNDLSNLQTLCKFCNNMKGINEINYRNNKSLLIKPKEDLTLCTSPNNGNIENNIARIVNEFYHCQAMASLEYHKRANGRYYHQWRIVL